MFKVIIADDEKSVRDRLVAFLEKRKDEFEIVGCYENGFDALSSGVPLEPDLIVTDVKMPFIDGLSLIRQAQSELPLVKAIIVSGFDSFDYARRAIDLGVVAYLTKPILGSDIDEALDKAKSSLEESFRKLEPSSDVVTAIRDQHLRRLSTFRVPPDDLVKKLQEEGVDCTKRYIAYVCYDIDEELEKVTFEQKDAYEASLKEACCEVFGCEDFRLFDIDDSNVMILFCDSPVNKSILEKQVTTVIMRAARVGGVSLSAGISEIGDRTSPEFSFRRLLRHARWALDYRAAVGRGVILSYGDLPHRNEGIGKIDDNEFKVLVYEVSAGHRQKALEIIGSILERLSKPEYTESYLLIIGNIFDSLIKACASIERLYSGFQTHAEMLHRIHSFKGKEGLNSFFTDLVDAVIAINNESRSHGIDEAYEKIMAFLRANYADSELSLSLLAGELGYSLSYVSAIFKRNGNTFTKALTEIRMQKAAELLLDPASKIGEVGRQVGYEDPYYFSHCYKRYFGHSPRKKE